MNIKSSHIGFLAIVLAGFSAFYSCKPKDEILTTDPVDLSFSVDTVLFDTVFTETVSITKRLVVTNNSKNAVNIAQIYVNPNSPYSLIINGEETNSVKDFYLRGGDNVLILVKAELGKNNDAGFFIVEDSVQFLTNGGEQFVKLLSWGRDAIFHTSSNPVLCDEIWTNEKPHVILDLVYVQPGCKLTIMSGTEVYVHPGSFPFYVLIGDSASTDTVLMAGNGMLIGGTLEVLGNEAGPVSITDDRLEEEYEHRPGLWGGIQFLASSENNLIQWAEISNTMTAIAIGKPTDDVADIVMENTIIRDQRSYGVYSISADIDMTNCLVTNSGQNSLACIAGGSYNIHHCTFAEYAFDFTRNDEVFSLFVSNDVELSDGSHLSGNLTFRMSNSIVWGEKGFNDPEEEMYLAPVNTTYVYLMDVASNNNIIRTLDPDDILLSGSSFNQDPMFPTKDSTKFHYEYTLLSTSPAIDAGTTINAISDDLSGTGTRNDGSPDIGAYEYQ